MGNGASEQLQLDVYGEVADAIVSMAGAGVRIDPRLTRMQHELTNYVASICHRPASGLWERRDEIEHFTYSKVMAWLALEHGIRRLGGTAAARWKRKRDQLQRQIYARGFSRSLGSFVQAFGSRSSIAAVLLIPMFGFLPFDDPRMKSTLEVIQRKLGRNGWIYRYEPSRPGERESPFIACSFWMSENLGGAGRSEEGTRLFEKLLAIRNDVGLLSEEYDPGEDRFTGNFPQALSHIALINAARMLCSQ